MAKIDFIMESLKEMYPEFVAKWTEKPNKEKMTGVSGAYLGKVSRAIPERYKPFRVLISTILSQRTRDEDTERASDSLFAKFRTPEEIMNASPIELARLIRPVGFYEKKAITIKEVSRIIHNEYHDKVPDELERLLDLPGVGRKTANCVLVFGFEKPAIPVDTHVHRISNRLGLVHTNEPEQTEEVLMKTVPKKYWLDINGLFVTHGKSTCKPIHPICEKCLLPPVCDYYKTFRVRKGSREAKELEKKDSKRTTRASRK